MKLISFFALLTFFVGPFAIADKYKTSRISLANGSFILINTVDVNKRSRRFLVSCGKVKNAMSEPVMRSGGIDPTPIEPGKTLTLRNYWRENNLGYVFKCHKEPDL